MKRRVAVRQHRVPFLHDRVIEEHAQLLLNEWVEAHPAITAPPVPSPRPPASKLLRLNSVPIIRLLLTDRSVPVSPECTGGTA